MEQNNLLTSHSFTYNGNLLKILWIRLVNIFLSIITLGIYSFWGRNRLRKYFVENVSLMGTNFEYTGKGGELLLGFIKVMAIYILSFLILSTLTIFFVPSFSIESVEAILNRKDYEHLLFLIFPFLYYATMLYIIIVGLYMAHRYRLSRTFFHGIRFKLTGSALKYGAMCLLFFILNICTLLIFTPYFDLKLASYKLNHTSFGDMKFSLKNINAKELLPVNIITLILAIPTLFLSRCWYNSSLINHICKNLKIGDDITVISNMTGMKIIKKLGSILVLSLIIFILLITAKSLNIAIISFFVIITIVHIIYIHNIIKLLAENISISGNVDFEQIKQADDQSGNSGEGILSSFGESII